MVPYGGGRVATGGTPVQGAEAVARAWAQHNGCTGPEGDPARTEVVRLDWTGCKEPLRVVAALLAVLAVLAFAACQSDDSKSATGSRTR